MSALALLFLGMLIVVIGIVGFRWHPFIALIVASLTVSVLTPVDAIYEAQLGVEKFEALEAKGEIDEGARKKADAWFVSRVTDAFGRGCAGIALIIAMAAIIGKCLLDSGGARRIVDSLMRRFGIQGTPFAFALSSFTLGIPVFFDTVFYLMIPLAKAMRRASGKDYLLYILTIVAGATMAHSLVPPTPGPLTVAGFFGDAVSVGSMMLGGLSVGVCTVSAGIAFAFWANRRWTIKLPDADLSDSDTNESGPLPPLWFALLPILLPVALIAGQTIFSNIGIESSVIRFLGDKNIALILSAGVSILLLSKYRISKDAPMREAVQEALSAGGVIILVTAAGSAFGSTLKDTGIAGEIGGLVGSGSSFALIAVAYGVTALVRTAQGSATVAMITAGGIIGPIAAAATLPYSALYLALAIGCGSKPISWANDSGFWVIGRMSGMSPTETFKTVSIMMIVMSLVGLAVVYLGAVFLPLV